MVREGDQKMIGFLSLNSGEGRLGRFFAGSNVMLSAASVSAL